MSKTKLLFILGIWVAVLPYLGFPTLVKNVLFSLSGLSLALFSYIAHREFKPEKTSTFDNFSENRDFADKA